MPTHSQQQSAMAEGEPNKPKAKDVGVVFDAAAKVKAESKARAIEGGDAGDAESASPAGHGGRLLRRVCCGLGAVAAVAAAVMLALSVTVLRVRDPTLSMDSVTVDRFSVRLGAGAASRPLHINVTLVAAIVIRNPNYESMRFGASATEFYVDGVPECVGLGSAPPGEVAARGTSRVRVGMDVFVDRVGPAVVGEVLFGGGEVGLSSHTAVDGRVSVLGGLYGRRAVRVAMRCRVLLRVSSTAVAAAGSPSCVADFTSH
ncbi:uncharacterized protein LOC121054520 [Oryza brachyantha]|uniref:uncharacterized protein LOC121054520 n=1 Tax=Oryza brachyantha TaxID=4533 RepID=UPI001ADD28E9|nr:uncharacterized protein LOC121054520 [Oryza brachyantha]XP_040380438.1 uncharacterized protein LOC121054520 [Oryza brachyantha]